MHSPDPLVPLAPLTTIGVGGAARWYVEAGTVDEVREAFAWAAAHGLPVFVLAGGSNVVIADEGFDGLVVRICLRSVSQSRDGDEVRVTAAAGESWDRLVAGTVEQGLAGIECLSGIPGTVGGTPIQNVGAYGQEVSATIERVTVFDRSTATVRILSNAECEFAYRSSRFKARDAGRFVVCDVTFRLVRGAPTLVYPDLLACLGERGLSTPTLQDTREAVLAVRARKGMVLDPSDADTRSVGSFFTNPIVDASVVEAIASEIRQQVPTYPAGSGRVKIPAAWLLEKAGFGRGYGTGAVGLSSKHPLAVVNRGGATARAIVLFAVGLKHRVIEQFGVALTPEPTFVGFGSEPEVKYLMAGAA